MGDKTIPDTTEPRLESSPGTLSQYCNIHMAIIWKNTAFVTHTVWPKNRQNSRTPWRYSSNLKFISTSCDIALKWIAQNAFDGKSTLVQVKDWCRKVEKHYLSLLLSRFLWRYGVTIPQCVKPLSKPILVYCQLDPWNKLLWKLNRNSNIFVQENLFRNILESSGHFVQGRWVNSDCCRWTK